jgi:hypothetical protein
MKADRPLICLTAGVALNPELHGQFIDAQHSGGSKSQLPGGA